MIRKEYEKPIVETIEFEVSDYIMEDGSLDPELSFGAGTDDGSNWP